MKWRGVSFFFVGGRWPNFGCASAQSHRNCEISVRRPLNATGNIAHPERKTDHRAQSFTLDIFFSAVRKPKNQCKNHRRSSFSLHEHTTLKSCPSEWFAAWIEEAHRDGAYICIPPNRALFDCFYVSRVGFTYIRSRAEAQNEIPLDSSFRSFTSFHSRFVLPIFTAVPRTRQWTKSKKKQMAIVLHGGKALLGIVFKIA